MNYELQPMVAVYTYPYPEVWGIVDQVETVTKDRNLYRTTIPVAEGQEIIDRIGFEPPLIVPAKWNGTVDLDSLHIPIIERITNVYENTVPALSEFKYRYPTFGSSEAIRDSIARLRASDIKKIGVLRGEYEGYKEFAKSYGMDTVELEPDEALENGTEPMDFFISNPSARDGNIIPNDYVRALCDRGHTVYLDISYAGSTDPHVFDASHENIPVVFLSFSKPYGLFRKRIGITYSREEIPSLVGNKWYKRDDGLLVGLKVAEEIGPEGLPPKYRAVQKRIVEKFNEQSHLETKPSDALLLAHIPKDQVIFQDPKALTDYSRYKRGDVYRFCLTPFYEAEEQNR